MYSLGMFAPFAHGPRAHLPSIALGSIKRMDVRGRLLRPQCLKLNHTYRASFTLQEAVHYLVGLFLKLSHRRAKTLPDS